MSSLNSGLLSILHEAEGHKKELLVTLEAAIRTAEQFQVVSAACAGKHNNAAHAENLAQIQLRLDRVREKRDDIKSRVRAWDSTQGKRIQDIAKQACNQLPRVLEEATNTVALHKRERDEAQVRVAALEEEMRILRLQHADTEQAHVALATELEIMKMKHETLLEQNKLLGHELEHAKTIAEAASEGARHYRQQLDERRTQQQQTESHVVRLEQALCELQQDATTETALLQSLQSRRTKSSQNIKEAAAMAASVHRSVVLDAGTQTDPLAAVMRESGNAAALHSQIAASWRREEKWRSEKLHLMQQLQASPSPSKPAHRDPTHPESSTLKPQIQSGGLFSAPHAAKSESLVGAPFPYLTEIECLSPDSPHRSSSTRPIEASFQLLPHLDTCDSPLVLGVQPKPPPNQHSSPLYETTSGTSHDTASTLNVASASTTCYTRCTDMAPVFQSPCISASSLDPPAFSVTPVRPDQGPRPQLGSPQSLQPEPSPGRTGQDIWDDFITLFADHQQPPVIGRPSTCAERYGSISGIDADATAATFSETGKRFSCSSGFTCDATVSVFLDNPLAASDGLPTSEDSKHCLIPQGCVSGLVAEANEIELDAFPIESQLCRSAQVDFHPHGNFVEDFRDAGVTGVSDYDVGERSLVQLAAEAALEGGLQRF